MARRGRGEGAVYQRSDGRWEAQLRLPDGQRKSIYARSRGRAVTKLGDAAWRVDHGLPLLAAKRRVGDYLEYWLEVTRRRVRPTTYEAYELFCPPSARRRHTVQKFRRSVHISCTDRALWSHWDGESRSELGSGARIRTVKLAVNSRGITLSANVPLRPGRAC